MAAAITMVSMHLASCLDVVKLFHWLAPWWLVAGHGKMRERCKIATRNASRPKIRQEVGVEEKTNVLRVASGSKMSMEQALRGTNSSCMAVFSARNGEVAMVGGTKVLYVCCA